MRRCNDEHLRFYHFAGNEDAISSKNPAIYFVAQNRCLNRLGTVYYMGAKLPKFVDTDKVYVVLDGDYTNPRYLMEAYASSGVGDTVQFVSIGDLPIYKVGVAADGTLYTKGLDADDNIIYISVDTDFHVTTSAEPPQGEVAIINWAKRYANTPAVLNNMDKWWTVMSANYVHMMRPDNNLRGVRVNRLFMNTSRYELDGSNNAWDYCDCPCQVRFENDMMIATSKCSDIHGRTRTVQFSMDNYHVKCMALNFDYSLQELINRTAAQVGTRRFRWPNDSFYDSVAHRWSPNNIKKSIILGVNGASVDVSLMTIANELKEIDGVYYPRGVTVECGDGYYIMSQSPYNGGPYADLSLDNIVLTIGNPAPVNRISWDSVDRIWIPYTDAVHVHSSVYGYCMTHRRNAPYHCEHCGSYYMDEPENRITLHVNGKEYHLCNHCLCEDYIKIDGQEFLMCNVCTPEGHRNDYYPIDECVRVYNNDANNDSPNSFDYYLLADITTTDANTGEVTYKGDIVCKDGTFYNAYCTKVNNYFFKPRATFFGSPEDDKYLGIEWEAMDGGEDDDNASKICFKHPELYCKHDGSLDDGIETVTHPCSVKYHLNELGWDKVMATSRNLGYDTPDGSGIHVHVSKTFWGDTPERIANMIRWTDTHRESLCVFADRDEDDMDHWAQPYFDADETIDLYSRYSLAYMYRQYKRQTHHYAGVNLSNTNTVELRFFHSTMYSARMKSIIEFVDVLTDLSNNDNYNISWSNIYIAAVTKGYIELLRDKHFIAALKDAVTEEDYGDANLKALVERL